MGRAVRASQKVAWSPSRRRLRRWSAFASWAGRARVRSSALASVRAAAYDPAAGPVLPRAAPDPPGVHDCAAGIDTGAGKASQAHPRDVPLHVHPEILIFCVRSHGRLRLWPPDGGLYPFLA